MACHYLFMKDSNEFYARLKDRDFELVSKMTKCVLSGVKRKKDKVQIFDITFKDQTSLSFDITRENYKNLLERCLNDFIAQEEYETCAEIVKCIKKLGSK